jgi:hypothetical protein
LRSMKPDISGSAIAGSPSLMDEHRAAVGMTLQHTYGAGRCPLDCRFPSVPWHAASAGVVGALNSQLWAKCKALDEVSG